MRIAAALLIVLVAGCATGQPKWVRADGSPGSEEQLKRDMLRCFPTASVTGPGTVARDDAQECMRSKGWKRPSS